VIPYERQEYVCPLCEWTCATISGRELRRMVAEHDDKVHGILRIKDYRAGS
jgi:predicted small metal-binding protein